MIRSVLISMSLSVLPIYNLAYGSENLWQHQIGARAGVLGGSLEYAYGLSPGWVVRVNWQKGRYESNPSSTTVYYDEQLNLESIALIFDWHPWYNSFRMSAGLVSNNSEVTGKVSNTSELRVGRSTYSPSELSELNYTADYQDAAVYFGLGWGIVPGHYKRWSLNLDAGVYVQQKPTVIQGVAIGVDADLRQLQRDLDLELAAVREDLDDRKLMPTVMVGVARLF